MASLFRILRSIALACWVGGLVFFGFVAEVAFTRLPVEQAGTVVRGTLMDLHHIGLIAGFVYFLLTLALLATQRDSHPARALELALVVAMLVLTLYSQYSVIPRMEKDRIALGGDVSKAPDSAPQKQHFNRLHGLSVKMEGAVLIEGLLLLALAPIHGREDYDRFS